MKKIKTFPLTDIKLSVILCVVILALDLIECQQSIMEVSFWN